MARSLTVTKVCPGHDEALVTEEIVPPRRIRVKFAWTEV